MLKYAPNGTLLWQYIYNNNGNDIPIAISAINNSIYLLGGSEGNGTLTDYCLVKLNNDGTQQWVSRYDYNNLYDIPAGMVVDANETITITGASSNSIINWEYSTVTYNSNGLLLDEHQLASVGTGISKPTAIASDNKGDFYITGQSALNPANPNIKTIKLNSNLNLEWSAIFDGAGEEDMATSIDVDLEGNTYITGYMTESGRKIMVTIMYDLYGNEKWVRKSESKDPTGSSEAFQLKAKTTGGVVVVGEKDISSSKDIVSTEYNKEGELKWEQTYDGDGNGDDEAKSVTIDNQSNVYVTGKSFDGVNEVNTTIKYSSFKRPAEPVFNASGTSGYIDRMVIIRFKQSALNLQNMSKMDYQHGEPAFFLTAAAYNELDSRLAFNLGDAQMVRVFRKLDPSHTTSKSRNGRTIPIPDFWTTLTLIIPEGKQVKTTCQTLKPLTHLLKYAHPNYLAKASSSPPSCPSTDPESINQASLHPTTNYSNAHINMEPAWCREEGDPGIKVGIIDSALDQLHYDFGYDGTNPSSSVVKEGWSFENTAPTTTVSNLYPFTGFYNSTPESPHGTSCGGIVGAVRNNGEGVAGIAGGNASNNLPGASLYSLRVSNGTFFVDGSGAYPMDYIAEAIVYASADNGQPYAWGLHILNLSWGINETDYGWFDEANILVLHDACQFSNKNEVTLATAAGNQNLIYDNQEYPSDFFDDWILNVGGTGTQLNANSNLRTSETMDIAAPSNIGTIYTTFPSMMNGNSQYTAFGATSAATPHTAGVSALLLGSVYNSNSALYLAPEDIEHILEETADNVVVNGESSNGWDSQTGLGRINAEEALKYVRNPNRRIVHQGNFTHNGSLISQAAPALDIDLEVIYPYELQNGIILNPGQVYKVDVYPIIWKTFYTVPALWNFVDAWARPSSITGLMAPFKNINGVNYLMPYEHCELVSTTSNGSLTELTGFVYKIKDTNGTLLDWLPRDPATININNTNVEYTQLFHIGPTSTDNVIDETFVSIYPNPSKNNVTITFENPISTYTEINLYSVDGKFIKKVFEGQLPTGKREIEDNVEYLPSGVYLYNVTNANVSSSVKFVKL